jgi:hypothetical protein
MAFPSQASFSLPNISEELRKLFEWNPPVLHLSPTSSKSTASRKPSFYDKLLDDEYILHQVRLLPSLAEDIAHTVDTALQSIDDRNIQLPAATMSFPTLATRLLIEASVDTGMKNEGSVAQFYGRTTATYCASVASMLALHPNIPLWTSILSWTSTPSKSGYAIADGSINIIGYSNTPVNTLDPIRNAVWDGLDPSMRQVLLRVKSVYPDLATWEIKSLSVGTHEVMLGVGREASTDIEFFWERLDQIESAKSHRQYEAPSVGPDALVTPWTLLTSSASSVSSASMDAPETSAGSRTHGQPRRGNRARGSKGTKSKKRNRVDDDESYKDRKELTAEIYIQQVSSIS